MVAFFLQMGLRLNVFKIGKLTFLLRTVIICFAIILHLLFTFVDNKKEFA